MPVEAVRKHRKENIREKGRKEGRKAKNRRQTESASQRKRKTSKHDEKRERISLHNEAAASTLAKAKKRNETSLAA